MMNILKFALLQDQDRDIIIHYDTGLKVCVFNLEAADFRPSKKEQHIFGDDHGEWLAFETKGWHGQSPDILHQAALWYARYLDYPEMIISDVDPRPVFKMRIL
ncbi:hypothetical protein [Mucilaginibacter terrae]|uniref:Uncharacterized protein n=1 Tax=Mucilaginibacter terrae TaxID=1955052 RepID=A0ABU3GMK2_9SPHI|nr:hypothetical protein [Mucilaginibacter terrae]MDT3401012.1 hypothetical protein [Mucilaginibacter terrae]